MGIEVLTEDNEGHLFLGKEKKHLGLGMVFRIGKIKTIKLANPVNPAEEIIQKLKTGEISEPYHPFNAILVSDYNPDTMHIIGDGKNERCHSVYAYQLYWTPEVD